MNTTLKTKEDQDFEDALSFIPEEVQNFMWSDEFTDILNASQKTLSLSESEKELMRTSSYDLLLNLTDLRAVAKKMETAGIAPEKISKILYVIQQMYLIPAAQLAEESIEPEDEAETEEKVTTAPSPSDMLTRLNQTMTTPTILAPTKRDYSAPTESPAKPSFDPYRETPDNK